MVSDFHGSTRLLSSALYALCLSPLEFNATSTSRWQRREEGRQSKKASNYSNERRILLVNLGGDSLSSPDVPNFLLKRQFFTDDFLPPRSSSCRHEGGDGSVHGKCNNWSLSLAAPPPSPSSLPSSRLETTINQSEGILFWKITKFDLKRRPRE